MCKGNDAPIRCLQNIFRNSSIPHTAFHKAKKLFSLSDKAIESRAGDRPVCEYQFHTHKMLRPPKRTWH
jgi:hypothetical protein